MHFAWLIIIPLLVALALATAAIKAAPHGWTDPAGDVSLANADIISGSATASENFIDFRLQFLDDPFPKTATHQISICLDTDQDKSTGSSCGAHSGADLALSLSGGLGALETGDFSVYSSQAGSISSCSTAKYNFNTKTLRLLIPLTYIDNDRDFNYYLISAFGGSFGANERVPDLTDFGIPDGYLTNETGDLNPFDGTPLCRNRFYLPIITSPLPSPL